ncbi:hypothetical protein K8T06_08435 [bacterium]|nr:hypothetical protein [bacterium]
MTAISYNKSGMNKYIDIATLIIIVTTFALFSVALLAHGITRDLFLEVGILLVSVKLILLAYKNSMYNKEISKELHQIKEMLDKQEKNVQ